MQNINGLLKPSVIAINIAAIINTVSILPAYGDDWVIEHPWIFTNPNQVKLSDELVDGTGSPVLGADGRPLIILYEPGVDSVLTNVDDKLVLKTNIFSFTTKPAINVNGSLAGIDNKSGMTIWSWNGSGSSGDPAKAAIHVGGAGTLKGTINNTGIIKGGVYITSSANPTTGSVYKSSSYMVDGSTLKSTLEDGLWVTEGGTAKSVDDHAINIQDQSYLDYVVVGKNSSVTAEGTGNSAIYVESGGELGGNFGYTHNIATLRTLTPDETSTGALLPNDPATGYPRAGDADDLKTGLSASNFVTVDFDGNGVADGKPDLYSVFDYSLSAYPNITGSISRAETDTAILVEGSVTSTNFSAINIEGDLEGKIHITSSGTVRGAGGGGKDKGGIWNHGTHQGSIYNEEGYIEGGVFVSGTQTASSAHGEAAYHAKGINSDYATLKGSYSVVEGGTVTAQNNHAVYLDRYSVTDYISVRKSGSEIKAQGTDHAAIYIEEDGVLGGAAAGRTEADSAIIVESSGKITSELGSAINVKGQLLGHINVDKGFIEATGTTQNAIHIASTGHVGASSLGGSDHLAVVVQNSGSISGTGSAVHVEGKLFGKVHINNGTLSGAGTNGAVYVSDTGEIKAGAADAILIEGGGEISSTGTTAIKIDGLFTGAIHIGSNGTLKAQGANPNAIDFSSAKSALHFVQDGTNASTIGSIRGSTTYTDKVEILSGSFSGQTIADIDELVLSTNADIDLTQDLIMAKKTTIQVEEGHTYTNAIIEIAGTGSLSANTGSELKIKPGSLTAYRELATGPKTLIIASVTGSGSINGNTANNITTGLEGVTLDYVQTEGALIETGPVVIDGSELKVTVSKVNDKAFYVKLLEDTLSQTSTTLIAGGGAAIVSSELNDLSKAETLFASLSSTTDFKTLAVQVAQPLDITVRAGLGDMNTAQNITLREARSPLYGFSYGDGFNNGEFWGQIIYSKSDQDTVSKTAGYDGKTNGYIFGAGRDFSDNWRAGIAGAWTRTQLSSKKNSDLTVTSYIGSLYSNWQQQNWFFDTLVTLGVSKNDTQKYIGNQKVEADYDSTLWGLRLVAGRTYDYGNWQLSPQAEFNYGRVDADEYTEKGNSGWEVKIKASDYEVMELGGGLRLNHDYLLADGSIRPELSLMGYYDIKERGSEFEATYLAGGDPFVVAEAERDRFRMQSALGVSVDVLESWTLNAAYNLNWSDNYRAHSFSAKARYQF